MKFGREIFLLVAILGFGLAQRKFRLFNAAFEDCGSGITVNSVQMSAPPGAKCDNRHLLVKKRKVQICVNGTIPVDTGLPSPVAGGGLKNVAHGTLVVFVHEDFCEIELDGCKNAFPPCETMKPGDNIQLCSTINVPDVPFLQPDVTVRWRVLREEVYQNTCEKRYETPENKIPLICADIKTRVVDQVSCS